MLLGDLGDQQYEAYSLLNAWQLGMWMSTWFSDYPEVPIR